MTAREALEQVYGLVALENLQRGTRPTSTSNADQTQKFLAGDTADILDDRAVTVDATTRTGAEAQAIADKPHLTGDPEWDALELAETDPTKPALVIQR